MKTHVLHAYALLLTYMLFAAFLEFLGLIFRAERKTKKMSVKRQLK